MPRRCAPGCFNLPCIQKKCPLVESDDEDFPVKDSDDKDFSVKNELQKLTLEDLRRFTSHFSPKNLVGVTQLGKLYRGKMVIDSDVTKDVAVKILGIDEREYIYTYTGNDKLEKFEYELKFLQAQSIKGHPNLVRVIGYCEEEETFGIVCDLNPYDTLEKLITRANYNWMQRVRTALTLARLLNYLDDRKYLIHNFAPYHIVVVQKRPFVESDDEDFPVKDSDNEDFPMKDELQKLTLEDLHRFTSHFSPKNLVGVTHLGKLYRGKMVIDLDITKDVAVKILGIDERGYIYTYTGNDKLERFEYELKFLQAQRIKGHPNLVKVIGYCEEEETFGIVYDLNPYDTLENLITRADFNWMQRVRAALTLARLLSYLHDRKYLIRNFAPYHIVVDQDFTPIMFEFGLLVGGVLGNTIHESDRRFAPYGYIDRSIFERGTDTFSVRSDVFAFGVSLINLIRKKVVAGGNPLGRVLDDLWDMKDFKPGCSLVHQSLVGDAGFDPLDGVAITGLAKQCVEMLPMKRPYMKEVVARLEGLRVVQEHGEEINVIVG